MAGYLCRSSYRDSEFLCASDRTQLLVRATGIECDAHTQPALEGPEDAARLPQFCEVARAALLDERVVPTRLLDFALEGIEHREPRIRSCAVSLLFMLMKLDGASLIPQCATFLATRLRQEFAVV